MATEPKPLCVLKAGYYMFKLPDSVKLDGIKAIMSAIQVDTCSEKGKLVYMPRGNQTLEIEILSPDRFKCLVDNTKKDHPFRVLIDKIKNRLEGKEHISLVFAEKEWQIGGDSFPYPDPADPDFDPDNWIEEIVTGVLS